MAARISLMTVFSGNIPKLKRKVIDFLNGKKVGCILQTTVLCPSQERMTMVILEGEKVDIYQVRDELVLYLNSLYPGEISNRGWEKMVSENPLPTTAMVKKTPNSFDPDSSENDSPTSNEKETAANAVKYEKWITGLMNGAYKTLEIVNNAAKVVKSVSDSFKGLDVKMVYVSYKNNEIYINVGKCRFWQDFKALLRESATLSIPKEDSLKVFIKKQNGDKAEVDADIDGLEAGKSYFVETESSLNEAKPKFNTLEEFFEALKDEEELDDEEIQIINKCFSKQKIKFKQLLKTGDLAITDEKLEKIGISQMGLRTAILSLIKNNRK